jgi:hypothetical protein
MIWFIGLFYAGCGYILHFTITLAHTHARTQTLTHASTHKKKTLSVHSHVFSSCCSVVLCNGGCSPSSVFPLQLPDSHSNSWQLSLSSSLTDWLTQSLTNHLHSTDVTDSTSLTVLLITPSTGRTKNTAPLLLFTDRCLAIGLMPHCSLFKAIRPE